METSFVKIVEDFNDNFIEVSLTLNLTGEFLFFFPNNSPYENNIPLSNSFETPLI